MLSGRELGVDPFERPVELMRPRPRERGARAVIVVAELKQPVARLTEGQRLRSGLGRGKGGERHEAIMTPLDRADNAPKRTYRAHCQSRLCGRPSRTPSWDRPVSQTSGRYRCPLALTMRAPWRNRFRSSTRHSGGRD